MPRQAVLSIAPEDKRSETVTLKLTKQEHDLLNRYAAQLDSDKSYVAGKIFAAFIPQALKNAPEDEVPETIEAKPKATGARKADKTEKVNGLPTQTAAAAATL